MLNGPERLLMANKRECKGCGQYWRPEGHEDLFHSDECREKIYKAGWEKARTSKKKPTNKPGRVSPNPKAKKKKKKKPEEKTPHQLSEDVATLLQLLVRLEASDEYGMCTCVTCGVRKHYQDGMQGGHFISRGKKSTKLLKMNVHPQCKGCNMPSTQVDHVYTIWMIEQYGQPAVKKLINLSYKTKKFTRDELAEMAATFKEEITAELARLS
jgi:hypothetical protein